jgi:hypothetical protein
LLAFGTEFDWLQFLYGINNETSAGQRWSMSDVFDAYVSTCGGSAATPASCTDRQVSWAGGGSNFSLVSGVQSLATLGFKTQAATDRFQQLGDSFGVSNVR